MTPVETLHRTVRLSLYGLTCLVEDVCPQGMTNLKIRMFKFLNEAHAYALHDRYRL